MSDEEQIRRVLALSMHYADDRNACARSDLYAEDARYYPSSGGVDGRSDIYESMAGRVLHCFVRSGGTWLLSENRIETI